MLRRESTIARAAEIVAMREMMGVSKVVEKPKRHSAPSRAPNKPSQGRKRKRASRATCHFCGQLRTECACVMTEMGAVG